MKVTEKVAALVGQKISELGYELYDVEFNKEYGSWELLIYIDSPSGVTLDDCERVSVAIDPMIEEADPIEQAYYLTVSSVGIDRPLKLSKDYDRNIGNAIEVKLYAAPSEKALGKKKNFTAVLTAHDEETFTVEYENGSYTFPKKAAALLRPHIDF